MRSGESPMRIRGLLAKAGGLVTMLALIVAPVCAPLCAAQVCSQTRFAAAQNGPCHLVEATHEKTAHIRGIPSCEAPEFGAVTVNSTNKNEVVKVDRTAFSVGVVIPSEGSASGSKQFRVRCFGCTSSPQGSTLSPLSVLRI
jgi:hypothetical protein